MEISSWITEVPIGVLYVILLINQIVNSYLRSWNVTAHAQRQRNAARISWFLNGFTVLFSLTMGAWWLIEFNPVGIAIWFFGSCLGQEISMRKW